MAETTRSGPASWNETASARERVRAVAETLGEPRSTNWISEQAEAAWSTTNSELADLVEQGRLRRVETGGSTLYQPDSTRRLFDEIRDLIEDHGRAELRQELTDVAEEIETWQASYGVETWEALEATLADGDHSSSELRERRDVVEFWQENERDRRLIRHALALYRDVEAARTRTTQALERATRERR